MSIEQVRPRGLADVTPSRFAGMLRKTAVGYAFILPALAIYAFFFIYPFVISIYYSLLDWRGSSKEFVGLANYRALAADPLLWESLLHNVIWIVLGTISPIAIGLLLGILLWSGARATTAFRAIYFLPFILPEVVIGIIWNWIYHPLWGPLNRLLRGVGLDSLAQGWLGNPSTALPALIVAAVWSAFGFAFVVIMAGLQDVSKEQVEAAMIDGANAWQRFTKIVIPELRYVLTVITAITLIGGFKVFDIIFVTTRGGPGTSTQVIATYTYRTAFQLGDIGYGAALSMVMTVLTLIASYLFIKFRERAE